MRKILYISGTRADYGLMRRTLFCIKRHPKLEVEIAVTGMHLMQEFGKTIVEIKKDRFKIHELKAIYRYSNQESMANFIGEVVLKLTKKIKKIKPNAILILGDRAEMLAAAIVGAYLTIPVAHIHGGDVTSTVDEISRHAVTKLSHLHLVATPKAAERVIKLGEDPWRVRVVGAPGLDDILNGRLFSKGEIARRYNVDLSKPVLLIIQHSVTAQVEDAPKQMKKTMETIKELGYQAVVIYPNADAGGRKMIEVIERYRKVPFIQIHKALPCKDYLSLMQLSCALIGNSSSGIIEAPSFHLPAVNIGTRQEGRERSENIIDVDYDKKQIKKAIEKAIYDKKFKEKIKKFKNVYGDGKANERIVRELNSVKIDEKLLHKKIAY